MKRKMKLTDLRHAEASKEDMKLIKGGEGNLENGPLCFGCSCSCSCSGSNTSKDDQSNGRKGNKNNGGVSEVVDSAIMATCSTM